MKARWNFTNRWVLKRTADTWSSRIDYIANWRRYLKLGRGFEDEFMDIQSSLVSLCLEALETGDASVDKIYIYAFAAIKGAAVCI